MTQQNQSVVRTNTEIIPDKTLSQPGWQEDLALEDELNKRLGATIIGAAVMADPALFPQATDRVADLISLRPYAARTQGFYDAISADLSLTPVLLHGCLKRHHPAITRQGAAELLTDNNFAAVREAVLDLYGFKAPKKVVAGLSPKAPPANESTTTVSPALSEKAA